MFCRWGRTWWMPRGSLAWRKSRDARDPPSSAMCHFQGPGAQTLLSYPVAVLQEAGEVTVRRLEADEVGMALFHHQEPFCIISGHCGDERLSLTLGPAFWRPLLALQMAWNFLPCQLLLPQGDLSHFPRECMYQEGSMGLFLE